MNIDKAIEIGTRRANDFRPGCDPEERDALKLLVEAGKRHRDRRKLNFSGDFTPLPGETEE